jgi:hypothetical protein
MLLAMAAPASRRRLASAGSASNAAIADVQAATSAGETNVAAEPVTSATGGMSLATTGMPLAIASSTGMPNPSASDGKANTEAAR